MKRYKVCFNDGEIIRYYNILAQAKAVKNDIFHCYVNRYAIIYKYSPKDKTYVKL